MDRAGPVRPRGRRTGPGSHRARGACRRPRRCCCRRALPPAPEAGRDDSSSWWSRRWSPVAMVPRWPGEPFAPRRVSPPRWATRRSTRRRPAPGPPRRRPRSSIVAAAGAGSRAIRAGGRSGWAWSRTRVLDPPEGRGTGRLAGEGAPGGRSSRELGSPGDHDGRRAAPFGCTPTGAGPCAPFDRQVGGPRRLGSGRDRGAEPTSSRSAPRRVPANRAPRPEHRRSSRELDSSWPSPDRWIGQADM